MVISSGGRAREVPGKERLAEGRKRRNQRRERRRERRKGREGRAAKWRVVGVGWGRMEWDGASCG
jgi:hypothetical protein